MKEYTFDSTKDVVERHYPTPLAKAYSRCRKTDAIQYDTRQKRILDLFELFIRFLCFIEIDILNTSKSSVNFELNKLKMPGTGDWVSLLDQLTKINKRSILNKIDQYIIDWFNESKNENNRRIITSLNNIENLYFNSKTKKPNGEICKAFVNYRNNLFAHTASQKQNITEENLIHLENAICYLYISAAFLSEIVVFHTKRIEILESNKYKLQLDILKGKEAEPNGIITKREMKTNCIYCIGFSFGKSLEEEPLNEEPIELSPFIIYNINEDKDLFVYNKARNINIEYISFSSGSFFHKREVPLGFNKLFEISLVQDKEIDKHRELSKSERLEKSEDYKKRAHNEIGRNIERAIYFLEASIEYVREKDVFLQMAKLQKKSGRYSYDSILNTVEEALLEDTNFVEAHQFRKEILNEKRKSEEKLSQEEDAKDSDNYKTYYHLLSPWYNHEMGWLFCIVIILSWMLFSSLTEMRAGNTKSMIAIFFGTISALPFVVAVVLGKKMLIRIRHALSIQSTMSMKQFEQWYSIQLKNIFGAIENQNLISICYESKKERYFIAVWVFYVLVFTEAAFFASESFKLDIFMATKRYIDFIMIFILWFPGFRYVIMTTLFINKYSKLTLKPMLTWLEDIGIRCFSPVMLFNLAMATIFYVFFWSGAVLMASWKFMVDIIFLGLASILYSVWSIGMPMMIRRAAKESQRTVMQSYAIHVESAFNDFIKEPEENSLKKYQWLSANQKIINKISTWPLSLSETIFVVVFSNIILIIIDVAYFLMRTGRLELIFLK